ncbi:hypothetical protein Tsubulata_040571 [Turnera subulata]|uniref:Uncharacterized protein n=1 Tax=Turnera subulata TaxID=218843 RepID=A0A9Q0G6B9_9ROSI|nr:hypothetical protein Tsubulata_040571 [Turnera subulata]
MARPQSGQSTPAKVTMPRRKSSPRTANPLFKACQINASTLGGALDNHAKGRRGTKTFPSQRKSLNGQAVNPLPSIQSTPPPVVVSVNQRARSNDSSQRRFRNRA